MVTNCAAIVVFSHFDISTWNIRGGGGGGAERQKYGERQRDSDTDRETDKERGREFKSNKDHRNIIMYSDPNV